MHTLGSILWGAPLLGALAVGCAPQDLVDLDSDVHGRPFDVMQQRVQSEYGDRFDDHLATQLGRRWPILKFRNPKPELSDGDWSYQVGGTVTSGVAVYNNAYAGGTAQATCADRLFVASTLVGTGATGGANNLYAFDNLSATPTGTTAACVNTTDGLCTASPSGWCPHRMWRISLNGGIDRSPLTFSVDGKTVYASTTTGFLYAVDGATGGIKWGFNARTEIGGGNANAGFVGSAPWVNYSDGTIYVAANYAVGTTPHIRLYKIKPTDGTMMYKLDIANDGIVSSVIAYDALYFGSTTGKVYKVRDTGTAFALPGTPWPAQLWAETSNGARRNPTAIKDTVTTNNHLAIFGTPTLDTLNNLLFVAVNNVFFSIGIFTGNVQSVEGGWQNATEALANDVPEYSSPWADPTLGTVFLGHGKDQSDTGGNADKGPRCHRRDYSTAGVFNTGTLTSVATASTSTDLSNPHSSPLVLHEPAPINAVYVFIGDSGGTLNRWTYTNDFTAATTFTTPARSAIESPIMIDYMAGNIYFGDDSGRVYQITQSSLK